MAAENMAVLFFLRAPLRRSHPESAGIKTLNQNLYISYGVFRENGASSDSSVADGGAGQFILFDAGRLRNNVYIGNEARTGGGFSVSGPGMVEVLECLFVGNRAFGEAGGGAIMFKGSELQAVLSGSVLTGNTVSTTLESFYVQQVVTLYTGSFGADGYFIPMWFVTTPCSPCTADDLPRQSDGNIDHLNVSLHGAGVYMSQQKYSTVVDLAPGRHRLYHGVLANASRSISGWEGEGWIEVMGSTDRIYVPVEDNRGSATASHPTARAAGCIPSVEGTPWNEGMCPYGDQFFWSYTDFSVGFGIGGGVSVNSADSVAVRDCRFIDNIAGGGEQIGSISAGRIEVTNTTFSSVQPTTERQVQVFGSTDLVDCSSSFPCSVGMSCLFQSDSRFCEACQLNEVGNGLSCRICPPGSQPSPSQDSCVSCSPGKYSTIGFCIDCPNGEVSESSAGGCWPCSPGTEPAANQSACVQCDPGQFSTTGVCLMCDAGRQSTVDRISCESCPMGSFRAAGAAECEDCPDGYYARDSSVCSLCPGGTQPRVDRGECEDCPAGKISVGGAQCADCPDGQVPDASGTACTFCTLGTAPREDRVSCVQCSAGRYSTGRSECLQCAIGYQPNAEQTSCQSCSALGPNFYSASGGICVECPVLMRANADWTSCVCKENTYDVHKYGALRCHDGDSTTMGELQCMPCLSCLECSEEGESLRLKAGYALYSQSDVYACPVTTGCFGAPIMNLTAARAAWTPNDDGYFNEETMKDQCAVGYAG